MKKVTDIYNDIGDRKKNIEFLPTGFASLDTFLDGGLLRQEMIVLGGKTGSGKSFVSASLFRNIATSGYKCAYFSLEISNNMIVSRLIGAEADINPTHFMMKDMDEPTQQKISEAKAKISVYEEFMYFYDNLYQYSDIEKEIKANHYDFVVIDFIQNMMLAGKEEYERLSFLAHSLQKLAKEQNCCILVVSQLSNMISKDKREDIVEYKGSGEIGIVCDLGFFMEKGRAGENSFSLRLRKNRRGITGTSFSFALLSPSGRVIEL